MPMTDADLARTLRGKFIAFDGGEGCGKTTQIGLLRDRLAYIGLEVLAVRDPGTTRIGELIRAILLNPDHNEMGMRCEMLLYMAARAQMMHETIRPALDAGQVVLTDRFVSSTLSYQLGGDGLTADEILATAQIALNHRLPDLTIILDMPPERAIERVTRAKDRIEQRPLSYHQQVRANFLSQAKAHPERYQVVSAERSMNEVRDDVWNAVVANAES
jgi:dTMP kinase